ncbi:MAG: hypothetical protein OEY14_14470 [Myxococcales bacterium]|nr:hypothetical protein [Myxococcales bacterium]
MTRPLVLVPLLCAALASSGAAQVPSPPQAETSERWLTQDEALQAAGAELASTDGYDDEVACRLGRRIAGVATHLCEAGAVTRLVLTVRLPEGAGWRHHTLAETGMSGDLDATGLWRIVHDHQRIVVGRYRHIEREQNGDAPTGYGPAIGQASAHNQTSLALFVFGRVEGEWGLQGEARVAEHALFAFSLIRPDGADGAIEAAYTETRRRRVVVERWGLRVGIEEHRRRGAWMGEPLPSLGPPLQPGRWRWRRLLELSAERDHPAESGRDSP